MASFNLMTCLLITVCACAGSYAMAGIQSEESETQLPHKTQQLPQPLAQSQLATGDRETASSSDVRLSARTIPNFVGRRNGRFTYAKLYPKKASVSKRNTAARDEASGGDQDSQSVHSVVKRQTIPVFVGRRAARYEARRAPWFIGKRAAIELDEDSPAADDVFLDGGVGDDDAFGSAYSKRGPVIPNFVGKRDPYPAGPDDNDDGGAGFGEKRAIIPNFVGKRPIPNFVGRRSDSLAYDERERRGLIPNFVGKRNQDAEFVNLVNELSREVRLQDLRNAIANEKRMYAPQFVGKRASSGRDAASLR